MENDMHGGDHSRAPGERFGLDPTPAEPHVAAADWVSVAAVHERAGFLDHLPDDARQALVSVGSRRRFPAGSSLFVEGERSERVVAVLRGSVKITSLSAGGRESVLSLAGPGDLIGELSAIDQAPRSASAVAMEPVDAIVVQAGDFEQFLERWPSAAVLLLRIVVARLRAIDRRHAEFGSYQAPARIAARLVDLAESHGRPDPELGAGAVTIDLPLSQDELAGMAGASLEAVAKALGAMRLQGLLITKRRRITILDLEGMRKRAP